MLKKIELLISDNEEGNISAISIVKNPAVEETFVKLSKSKLQLSIDEEEQIVTAPVLIPYQLIYRNSDFYLGECHIFFSAETIKKAAMLLMSGDNLQNVTLDHNEETTGATAFEVWLVSNPENDKAFELGFEVEKGTLMMSYHIKDADLWQKVKDGDFNGFSIEANFDSLELNVDEAKSELAALISDYTEDEINQICNEL